MKHVKVGKYTIDVYEKPFPSDGNEEDIEEWIKGRRREDDFEQRLDPIAEQVVRLLENTTSDPIAYWKAGDLLSKFRRIGRYDKSITAILSRISEKVKGHVKAGSSRWYLDRMVKFRSLEDHLSAVDSTIPWSIYWELLYFDDRALYTVYKRAVREHDLSKLDIRRIQRVLALSDWFRLHPGSAYSLGQLGRRVEHSSKPSEILPGVLSSLVTLGALSNTDNRYSLQEPKNTTLMLQLKGEIVKAEVRDRLLARFLKISATAG